MSAVEPLAMPPHLHVRYVDATADALLAHGDTLAVFGFGAQAPMHDDPRYLRVPLQPLGQAPLECWHVRGAVRRGRDGAVAWSEDGLLQFGAMELSEDAFSEGAFADAVDAGDSRDILAAAESIYERARAFTRERGYPHLLRMWNYLDGITHGEGDAERYRVFCVGRARGLGEFDPQQLPAATAVGRSDAERRLQVYWLASRTPGLPLENPRQVSAYRYPRQYGPQPPSFARAMLPPGATMPLLVSGTAAVVGHESRHAGDVAAQLDETLVNLDSLIAAAHARRPDLPLRMGAGTTLKVYVREFDEMSLVERQLRAKLDPAVRFVVLHSAICRRELRVEIDGAHAAP